VTWQSIISDAAVQCFLRDGKVPIFRLAHGDLVQLAAEVMKRSPESVERDLSDVQGFLGIRCVVHCAQLSRSVAVDEWLR